jgi:periplasmic protein TonB
MLERRNARPGLRIASVALAALGHAAAAGLLLIPALWLAAPASPEPIDVSLRYVAPAAPRLGGGGSAGEPAPVARAATPKPRSTPVFVEPQVIPDTTPEPAATAADAALAQADTGTGPLGIPGLPEGPGSPTGDPRSECIENCDENGLPGGSNPVPAHLLAIAPVPIDQPQPRYPANARDAGLTGAVVVEILVGVDGRVTQAKVVKGGPPFERATLEAVRRWRYAPVIHRGQPIVWKSTVTVHFELDGTSTRR